MVKNSKLKLYNRHIFELCPFAKPNYVSLDLGGGQWRLSLPRQFWSSGSIYICSMKDCYASSLNAFVISTELKNKILYYEILHTRIILVLLCKCTYVFMCVRPANRTRWSMSYIHEENAGRGSSICLLWTNILSFRSN